MRKDIPIKEFLCENAYEGIRFLKEACSFAKKEFSCKCFSKFSAAMAKSVIIRENIQYCRTTIAVCLW